MIHIYRSLSFILYPFLILLIFARTFFNKEDKLRYKEKIFSSCFSVKKNINKRLIWFHAASIGEVQSIFPFIEKINIEKKNFEILVTTTTLSSGRLFEERFNNTNRITHRYLPLDVNFLVKKFIELWKPNFVFFVDSEIWPNLITHLKSRKIPISLINGRISNKTFKRWRLFPAFANKIFTSFDLSITSNLETKDYLEKLGGKNIFNFGNLKFSINLDNQKIKNCNENSLLERSFWCAASTHYPEEEFCLKTHIKLKRNIENILTIIVPRHINRSEEILEICKKYKLNTQILNSEEKILNSSEIVIINSFGKLPIFFKYAKSVFIGKSMVKKLEKNSGQNPILAAKLGCKVYHGPFYNNFFEVYEYLKKNKISQEIKDENELSSNLLNDFKNEKSDLSKNSKIINDFGMKIFDQTNNKINSFLTDEF